MKEFRTTDLDLATALIREGLEYKLDRTNPKRVVLIFPDKEKAEEIAKDYIYKRTLLRDEILDG